jgi:hypothetical protein
MYTEASPETLEHCHYVFADHMSGMLDSVSIRAQFRNGRTPFGATDVCTDSLEAAKYFCIPPAC